MSTYYRLLREAAGVSATPETPLPRGELLRAIARLQVALSESQRESAKLLQKERLETLETWTKAAGNQQRFINNLEETRGKNRRTAIMALQNDVANIRDNFTQLADTVNPALQRAFNLAVAAGNEAAAGGNKDAANAQAWSTLLGDLLNAGELNEANLQLHTIFAQMEAANFGSIEDLLKNPEVDPNSNLPMRARQAAAIAEAAYKQKIAAQRRMDDSLGGLAGIIETMANADTNANLDGLVQQASKYVNTFYEDVNRFQPKSPDDAANDLNVYLAGNDAYQEHREAIARLESYLKSPDGADIRQQIASVIGDPNFRDWATSNGWKIGKAQLDPDTGEWLYVQGKDDARALRTYEYQLKHDPQQLIRDYNTKTWVAVTTKGVGEDVQLVGSVSTPLLQAALGIDSTATTPLYAAATNEAGETVYLTGEQMDAILSPQKSDLPTPMRIFSHTSGNETRSYLYDPVTAAIYVEDTTTGKWVPSTKKLEELGYTSETIHNAAPAVIMAPDGSYSAVNRDNIGDYEASDTVPASVEEFRALQGEVVKKNLDELGIKLTDEPPPAPTYVTYGKLIRRHATDPQGSIRVSTLGGEQLIMPEQVVKVEQTAVGSNTSLLDARDRLRGVTNERIAARLPHPTGEYDPNIADRIAASAEGRRVEPLPGPRVEPNVIAGRARVEDGFGTGTFMDQPDLVQPNIPAVATMSGFPTPTPEQVLRGTRTLSDTGEGVQSALKSTLDYRASQPPITPPPVNSRSDMPPTPMQETPPEYIAQQTGQRISDSYGQTGPVSLAEPIQPPESPPPEATPTTPPTPPTPPPAETTDADTLKRFRAIVERVSRGTKTVNERGEVVDVAQPTASPPADARRSHVEAASNGLATLDADGFVVAKDGSANITDQLYSSERRVPYEKFVAKYPEKAEMSTSPTSTVTPPATPQAATPPATPPAPPPASAPPAAPPPRTFDPKQTMPTPPLTDMQRADIERLRPIVEKKSGGVNTVNEKGEVVPVTPAAAPAAPPAAPKSEPWASTILRRRPAPKSAAG